MHADGPLELAGHPGEELLAVRRVADRVDGEVEPGERGEERRHLHQLVAHRHVVAERRQRVRGLAHPRLDDRVVDGDRAEQQEEQVDRHRQQQHLDRLGEQQREHQVGARHRGQPHLRVPGRHLGGHSFDGRAGAAGDQPLPRRVTLDLAYLLGQPHQQEQRRERAEEQHAQPQQSAGSCRRRPATPQR